MNIVDSLFKQILKSALLFIFILFLGACGGKEVAWYGPVADLGKFPQNLEAFVPEHKGDIPMISQAEQDSAAERYKRLFFKPWSQKKSEFPPKDAAWASKNYANKGSWTQDGSRVEPDFWNGVIANANIKRFPSLGWKGILTENAPLRALPSSTPYFNHPGKPGEGYPFDYLAYSTLWVGMPVYVSHISLDEEWLFCETPLLSGWVPARAVSPVSDSFISKWQSLPLLALVKDKVPVTPGRGNVGAANTVDLRLGTLLPHAGGAYAGAGTLGQGTGLLLPVPQGIGTSWQTVAVPDGSAAMFPLAFTPGNVARIGNEIMGEPYGWGGIDYLRDCSAMLRDLYAPFGIWLPRNSAQQIKLGQPRNLSGMTSGVKEQAIKDFGAPFRTLIGLPGHVMLYVGEYDGRVAVFHDIWGLRTDLGEGAQGRLIIGKVAVTSLEPGAEHPQVSGAGTLLERINALTVIP